MPITQNAQTHSSKKWSHLEAWTINIIWRVNLQESFAESIHLVGRTVDIKQLTSPALKKYGALLVFMDNHCHTKVMDFRFRNVKGRIACIVLFSNHVDCKKKYLKHLSFYWVNPGSILDQSKEHYKGFNKLYGTISSKKDRTSLHNDLGA